jgi:hypothetical protein
MDPKLVCLSTLLVLVSLKFMEQSIKREFIGTAQAVARTRTLQLLAGLVQKQNFTVILLA